MILALSWISFWIPSSFQCWSLDTWNTDLLRRPGSILNNVPHLITDYVSGETAKRVSFNWNIARRALFRLKFKSRGVAHLS